jgi:hypothetical protein
MPDTPRNRARIEQGKAEFLAEFDATPPPED